MGLYPGQTVNRSILDHTLVVRSTGQGSRWFEALEVAWGVSEVTAPRRLVARRLEAMVQPPGKLKADR